MPQKCEDSVRKSLVVWTTLPNPNMGVNTVDFWGQLRAWFVCQHLFVGFIPTSQPPCKAREGMSRSCASFGTAAPWGSVEKLRGTTRFVRGTPEPCYGEPPSRALKRGGGRGGGDFDGQIDGQIRKSLIAPIAPQVPISQRKVEGTFLKQL